MHNVQQQKHRMREYLTRRKLRVARMNVDSPVWGLGARTNAWRVTGHAGKASTSRAAVEAVLWPSSKPHIVQTDWKWAHPLSTRSGNPPGVVWHNAAGNGPASGIHAYHISLGWCGIAYHYYVRKDGTIYAGRPEWAMGGHCLNHNDWLGVCAEGNYEGPDKVMPAAQLRSMRALHDYLHAKYKGLPDKRHSEMPGNSTACPGRYFPFATITK